MSKVLDKYTDEQLLVVFDAFERASHTAILDGEGRHLALEMLSLVYIGTGDVSSMIWYGQGLVANELVRRWRT